MLSRTDTAGHSKAFDYPVMGYWGGSQSTPAQGRFEPLPCRSTVEHTNHQTTMRESQLLPTPLHTSFCATVLVHLKQASHSAIFTTISYDYLRYTTDDCLSLSAIRQDNFEHVQNPTIRHNCLRLDKIVCNRK